MPVVLGIDLGTTRITALAVDTATGDILASVTQPNRAETTSPADKARGYSEWDIRRIAETACACLRDVADRLAGRRAEFAGLGITGQQHGVVLLDGRLVPQTPLVNWQDRRGEETYPGTVASYVAQARERTGADAPERTGCRLAAGYLAVTLFWMRGHGVPLAGRTACFVMDYFAALLTGRPPVTDATCAASSGILNVVTRQWDRDLIAALGLGDVVFPEVRPSGERLGGLTADRADATGLPIGLPISVGIGDNQASFLGSVADPDDSVLVNVGTGGQVAAYTRGYASDPLLETRPFPGEGYLLVCAGLSGGQAYATLERFFRQVGVEVFDAPGGAQVYERMNRLAACVPRGTDGLRCDPFFVGTRQQPDLRAAWTGVSAENFTPGHLARALLEGMARAFHTGYGAIATRSDCPRRRLVGAGNGLRENPVLAQVVAEEFGLPLVFPVHRDEAALGAALLAAVGAGVFPDLDAARRLIRYSS
jgi:sugar (pentulose or hexulose) kinase